MEHFILRNLTRRRRSGCRCFHDAAVASTAVSSIKWVRDRALDHAVEKERDLKTVLNLKNLIKSEPSKSVPLSIISDNRDSLGIPFRPIDFLRKYSSVFEEFLPGGIGIHPHIKLTPETLDLDDKEQLVFQRVDFKKEVADRLLKLLMIARINRIPLCIIDRLRWDLGLPQDYTQSVVPEFPDYFQVTGTGKELELVCWSDELAVSVMEKNSMSSFPIQYSRGFEVDKKFKKWVDDWQKLPYVSPYCNALHLQAKSDESDKWAVALLHEILHLLVPKKTEKDNLLILGEYLGVRSRFKKALLQHPGIFYVSSKLHKHTVVLREAYKRDLLIGKPQHPLMEMRSMYLHLMNIVKKEDKSKNVEDGEAKQKASQDTEEGEGDVGKEEEDEAISSDSECEGVTDENSDDDEMEGNDRAVNRGRDGKRMNFDAKKSDNRGNSTRKTKFTHDGLASRNPGNSRKGHRSDNHGSVVRRNSGNSRKVDRSDNHDKLVNRNSGSSRKGDRSDNHDSFVSRNSDSSRKGDRSDYHDSLVSRNSGNSRKGDRSDNQDGLVSRNFGNSRKGDRSGNHDSLVSRNSGNSRKGDRSSGAGKGKPTRNDKFDENIHSRMNSDRRRGMREANPVRFLRTESPDARNLGGRSLGRSQVSRTRERQF